MKVGSITKLNQLMDDNVYPVVIQSANKLTFDQFFDDEIMSEMMEERRQELNKTLVLKSTSETNRMEKEILAKAIEESAIIRADAEKQALQVYQESLTKDIELYRFIQRMNSYKTLEGKTIFLDKDNEFLKYLDGYR